MVLSRLRCQASRRRLVNVEKIRPDESNQDEIDSRCKPAQTSGPVQSLDTAAILRLIVKTNGQKGNKYQKHTLGTKTVHETKVFAKDPIDRRQRLHPTKLVQAENRRKDGHVDAEESLRHVVDTIRFVLDHGQDSEGAHRRRQSHIPKGQKDEKGTSASPDMINEKG